MAVVILGRAGASSRDRPLIAVVVGAAVWFVIALVLLPTVWLTWCARGRYALVVYSNSPIWQEYFERRVLPAVGDRSAVLNWSERKQWRYSVAVLAFRLFGGHREFNPLAIVFRPFAWPRTFRFYAPFKAFKHGRPEKVEEMRRELLEMLDHLAPTGGWYNIDNESSGCYHCGVVRPGQLWRANDGLSDTGPREDR